MVSHGGDLSGFYSHNPGHDGPVVDLSTGINPVAYPMTTVPLESWTRLPQKSDETALIAAAGAYLGIDPKNILPTPGSQILISQLPYAVRKTCVQVMSPTYGEHSPSWKQAGHQVLTTRFDEPLFDEAQVCIITNPNNPDGHITSRKTIVACATALAARGGMLVVDEAFADVTPSVSVADLVDQYPIVVLRSFGKFFGLAGARLGFLVAAEAMIASMQHRLGPWAVPGPALNIAAKAYRDEPWIKKTRIDLADGMSRLCRVMKQAGCDHVGGTPLFALFHHADMVRLNRQLLLAGIYARSFEAHPNWLRMGLPATENCWQQLETTLETLS